MENSFDSIKGNKKLQEGIGLIIDAVSETVEKITTEKLANHYMNIGAINVFRGIINLFNTCMSPEALSDGLVNLMKSAGVEKIESSGSQFKVGSTAYQRVIDVYNDPEDPNVITSIKPGYVLKTDDGDVIIQYEDIKINEAHYDNPIELLIKKPNNNE